MGDHWKSLANKLGAPGIDSPVGEPVSAPEPAKPAAEPVAARPAPPTSPPPAPTFTPPPAPAPVASAPVHAERSEPVTDIPEPPATKDKSKRKSSWDTLTSFFGISSSEPAAEVSSAAPAETDSLLVPPAPSRTEVRETSSHKAAQPSKPTALDELFGSAPRQELTWEKPAPRRMVDDISSWDDDDQPVDAPADIDDQSDTFTPPPEAIDSDETRESTSRRRRRRRRGGSRRDREPRSDEVRSRVPGDEVPADDADPWVEDLIESEIEETEAWSEPVSFASDSDEPEAADLDADLDDAPMPERRSNRRRRRGRGRSERQPEGSLPAEGNDSLEPRPVREPREPREAREPREGREGRAPRESREARAARPAREPRAIEPAEGDAERPRREPRSGRGDRESRPPRQRSSRTAESSTREPSVVDEMDDQVDSSLAAELEGEPGSGNRHPKIPTWADSLEAIISANMENHKRSDHRGGGPRGGGRPRSNNGGNSPRR